MTPKQFNEMDDHDLLIRLSTKVEHLGKQFSNHLMHHWAVELMLAAGLLGATIRYVFF